MKKEQRSNTFWHSIFENLDDKLKLRSNSLPSLAEVLKATNTESSHYIGKQTIEVSKIIGSESRYVDFEKNFMLKNEALRTRYNNIKELHLKGHVFPPISVYKIDDYYFVQDGHHRVSVAKETNQEYIDADVTEFNTNVSITKNLSPKDLLLIEEHSKFLKLTGIGKHGRTSNIHLTKAHLYHELLEIITEYGKIRTAKNGQEYTLEKSAEEWYQNIFLPFAEDAFTNDLLSIMPGQTTGDLYIWVQTHWDEIRSAATNQYSYFDSLAKNLEIEDETEISKKELKLLQEVISRKRVDTNNFILQQSIGVAVCTLLFHIDKDNNVKLIIVRRKYHPCERQWSLPIGMMRKDETINEVSARCQKNVLGLKTTVPVKFFTLHDAPARHPFGRSLGMGMFGFLFDRASEFKLKVGDQASELQMCSLNEVPQLVFDHSQIVEQSCAAVTRCFNDFNEILELIPTEVSSKGITAIMNSFKQWGRYLEKNGHVNPNKLTF